MIEATQKKQKELDAANAIQAVADTANKLEASTPRQTISQLVANPQLDASFENVETDESENERAAAEAAKDLDTDYGDEQDQQQQVINFEEEEMKKTSDAIGKQQVSIPNLIRT